MPKFQIDGRVHLVNDFTLEVEAEDALAARRVAEEAVLGSSRSGTTIRKVKIQTVRVKLTADDSGNEE